jgi:hypothetical protein
LLAGYGRELQSLAYSATSPSILMVSTSIARSANPGEMPADFLQVLR